MSNQNETASEILNEGRAQIMDARGQLFDLMFICQACNRRSIWTNRLNDKTMRCAVCSHNEFKIEVNPIARADQSEIAAACERFFERTGCTRLSDTNDYTCAELVEKWIAEGSSFTDGDIRAMTCSVCELQQALASAGGGE